MNTISKMAAITLVIATTGLTSANASASWEGKGEACQRGKHAESGMQMKMHKKMHHQKPALNLTADQAKTLVSAKLIMKGNDRLTVGEVTEKDSDTFIVNIVTVDNSLVKQVEVDKNKGLPHRPHRGKR